MEINRNQYFLIGLIVLFFGLQLRLVDTYVLNSEATAFLARQTGKEAEHATASRLMPAGSPVVQKVVRPPEWLGWFLASSGSVLVLHSLAMRRPGT